MWNILNRLTEGLAERNSRRSFIGMMGKVVASLAAIATGEVLTSGQVQASPLGCPCVDCYDCAPSWCHNGGLPYCCTGRACPTQGYCPAGTYNSYIWFCCWGHITFACYDCSFNNPCSPNRTYACTWESEQGSC